MIRVSSVLSVVLVGLWVGDGVAWAQQATVTAFPGLTAPSNIRNSTAVGISGRGEFIGMTNLYGYFDPETQTAYPGVTHAFVSPAPETATDLGVLGTDPPPFTFPRGETFGHFVSTSGGVACELTDAAAFGVVKAGVWLPDAAFGFAAGLSALPGLATSTIDRAFGANDSGQLVGESRDADGNIRPVLWSLQGGVSTLTDLAPGFGPNGRGFAINNLGQAVGQVNEPNPIPFDNYFQAFLYLPQPAYGLPAGVTILQAPGVETADNLGFPNDINDFGQVAGRTAGFGWRPALWLPEPALGLPAGVTIFPNPFPDSVFAELRATGLDTAEFRSINSQGVAVGEAVFVIPVTFPRPGVRYDSHAFIWRNGRFELLEDSLPVGSSWTRIFRAVDINDNGEIAVDAMSTTGEFLAAKITLDAPPCPNGIIRQPLNESVCAGEDAEFTVWALAGGGGDLAYQWMRDGTPINDGPTASGSTIIGSQTNHLVIQSASVDDIGTYSVMAMNSCGGSASDGAGLDVAPLPAVTQQPVNAFACPGGSASFTVVGENIGGYQWEVRDPADDTNWAWIVSDPMEVSGVSFGAVGMFDSSLTVSNVQGLAPGLPLVLRCTVFGDCGEQVSDEALMSTCQADFNCSGAVSVQDIFDFLGAYFMGDPRADINASREVSVQDIFDFLAAYFSGCR